MTAIEHPETAAEPPLRFECDLPDPPEKVWRALSEPELLAAWLMPNDIEPQAGKHFSFAGPAAPIECQVLDAEPGRMLRFSWRERPGANDGELPAFERGPLAARRQFRPHHAARLFGIEEHEIAVEAALQAALALDAERARSAEGDQLERAPGAELALPHQLPRELPQQVDRRHAHGACAYGRSFSSSGCGA